MPRFLSEHIQDLTRELGFAPPSRRRRHLHAAEQLYWEIDAERNYPLDFLVYRITGYRPESTGNIVLTGGAVRADLPVLVEALSATLEDKAADFNPPPYDLKTLRRKLKVSGKTVSRYRRTGLFGRLIDFGDGRPRLGFTHGSVDRFLESRGERLDRAARFSRLDEPTRHAIVMRARRIAGRVNTSPFTVARHLARKYGRSTEAIRQLLLAHDQADPRVAIFPAHAPPLTEKQQRVIHRAYHRGIPVTQLAEHFGKARNAVYRAINRRRAKALRQLPIRHVYSTTFDLPDAEQVILQSEVPGIPGVPGAGIEAKRPAPRGNGERTGRTPVADATSAYLQQLYEQPLLSAEAERALFSRYNYLKFRAAKLRDELDRHQPRSSDLDRIETYLRWAVSLKHQLVRSNLRLVVSVARKHLSGRFSGDALSELIGEGNIVLLEAIETFDAGRGNRFSTYLTWALMRHFATAASAVLRGRSPGGPGTPATTGGGGERLEYWPAAMNPNVAAMEHAEHVAVTLRQLLDQLDERERVIITRHFGLPGHDGRPTDPQTLAQVAGELKISAERARQIEHRAMLKLRERARELGLTLPAMGQE